MMAGHGANQIFLIKKIETGRPENSLLQHRILWINMPLSRKSVSEQFKVTLWQENSAKPPWKGLNYTIDS